MSKMSLCYVLDGIERTIYESDENVKWIPKISGNCGEEQEFSAEIENCCRTAETFLLRWEKERRKVCDSL